MIYIFSGVGADDRVFKNIDLSGFQFKFIDWINPHTDESMSSYAKRLIIQINVPNPVLIGLSFGGIVAIEVAKLIDVKKIILIASIKNSKELPPYFRLAGWMRIYKLVSPKMMKMPSLISNWFFGISSSADQKLLGEILRDTNEHFLEWAIDKIVNWKSNTIAKSLVHIHGTADRILPYRFVHADISIAGGGHFMTVNKSKELTEVIRNQLMNSSETA